jgi:pilus assembly protein Flp/PilA
MTDPTTFTGFARLVAAWSADEAGATAVEYGLLASLMSVACIASFSSLGLDVRAMWDNISNKITDAMTR